MGPGLRYLCWIPLLPLVAAAVSALLKQRQRRLAATLAIGSMAGALLLSCGAFVRAVTNATAGRHFPEVFNFTWLEFGDASLKLGWMLDPLTAVMLVMVSLVGLLIFVYSVGYMAHDENFTRFFCFLSLFAAAMLGLVIANSLLLLFICWELVGLTSYLLIGFWFHKPSAAAAAKKAFIVTRIGDLALLLGMVWLYARTGTLVFYDGGRGCLEPAVLAGLVLETTRFGIAAATGIALLVFCGAIGKSGQVPLHVWLPDAMEGPTPVSALIHAATMVAAGVFLVARMFPLMAAHPIWVLTWPVALQVITWVGAVTAVFAASIAVAQNDIKRILAYSTVSQLGFMMMGLGAGGVAVGMFHLITHAFFKALLFLGAGSVIQGCHEEQDIYRLGGLRRLMPVTFATYAVGMMALSGVPLLFSGFWSKDAILHATHSWSGSRGPFYLGILGALLTAFYMTRQMCYVFFGAHRRSGDDVAEPHESPAVMTIPLTILAAFAVLLGFIGTPAWPWFQRFLGEEPVARGGVLSIILVSTAVACAGLAAGWWLYGRRPPGPPAHPDVLENAWPNLFTVLRRKYYVDEAYDWAVVQLNSRCARTCDWVDRWVVGGLVQAVAYVVVGLSWVDRWLDELVVNGGFDETCRNFVRGGGLLSRLQNGRVQSYLRLMALGIVVLGVLLVWGGSR